MISAKFPARPEGLGWWITHTPEGRAWFSRHVDPIHRARCEACQEPWPPPPRVLVVVRSLGRYPGAEVYADREARVKVLELIDTGGDPLVEAMADELIRLQLPKSWRDILLRHPQRVAFTGISAERRLQACEEMAWLEELDQWKKAYTSLES